MPSRWFSLFLYKDFCFDTCGIRLLTDFYHFHRFAIPS
ncbi:hypothetical protein CEV31_0263 [Brucella thiophenivorans]|uniref:Uncharacterized protein n=1 Tax=Brucella thiophenivorans TaxID=571255 RepID=A0A256G5I2_9HYPH|nr:hypothetical protein CEV31_0263 [Brucella thiophenivorans]